MERVLGERYPVRARDLARFTEESADTAISRTIAAAVDGEASVRDELRDSLTEADARDLLLYTRRQAAHALRQGSALHAIRAIDGFTLIDRDVTDFRDLTLDFPLYACRELGESVATVITRAAARCADSTAHRLEAARGRVGELTLADCGLLQIQSRYGVGFVDSWTHRQNPDTHRVNQELGAIAVALSDRIEQEGSYVTDRLAAAPLPAKWFTREPVTHDLPTIGCVVVRCLADPGQPNGHGLTIFIADVGANPGTFSAARQLVSRAEAASIHTAPRVAIGAGGRVCLVLAGSATRGETPLETSAALRRFTELAAALL